MPSHNPVGRPPNPNARRNGVRVPISPEHVALIDRLKVKGQSRSDFAEMAIEFFAEHLDAIAAANQRQIKRDLLNSGVVKPDSKQSNVSP